MCLSLQALTPIRRTGSPILVELIDLFYNGFLTIGNSDHVVVSVSIDFLINLKRDALFHGIAYDYSRADWDGLCDHLKDVP